MRDPIVRRIVLSANALLCGILFLALFFPHQNTSPVDEQAIRVSLKNLARLDYPHPPRNLPPPVNALSMAPTRPTGYADSPVEILELPYPGQKDPQSLYRHPHNAPRNDNPQTEEGLSEWTSRAGRTVQPLLVESDPTQQGDPWTRPVQIPALTSNGLIQPNSYYTGDLTEPECIVIADTLPVFQDPRADSPSAGPALTYLMRVQPLRRIRSETDFDWVMIGPSSEYPSGGWIMAEYLAPASKVAQMPAEGMSFTLGLEPVDRDHALPPDYQPHDLTALPTSMTYLGREVLVREPTARALRALMARAKREGVQLKVLSGFRPYSHQRKLYFDALVQLGPKQNGTAMPGHSEHQLGTTVDFIGPDVRAHLNGRFGDTPEGKFLRKYAEQYGFRNSYTEENAEESGYKPEPWHWRQVSEWSGPTD